MITVTQIYVGHISVVMETLVMAIIMQVYIGYTRISVPVTYISTDDKNNNTAYDINNASICEVCYCTLYNGNKT